MYHSSASESCVCRRLFSVCVVLCVFCVFAAGYNLDTKFPIVFKSSPENYFGYSVALHRNRDGPVALIGAPRANSSLSTDQLFEPGVLFRCDISFTKPTPTCTEVLLDKYGNTYTHRGNNLSYMDKKDKMWLGVSLDVQQNTAQNDIVICGHLWKNQYYSQHYLANGVCYVINSELDPRSVRKLVPFVNKSKQSLIPPGVYYYAFGQIGTSAAYTEDGKELLLGAPGFYDWIGTVLSYSLDPRKTYQEYSDPIVPEPPRDQQTSSEFYIGYSLTSGKFFDSNENFIAVGAPRDANSYGRVYISKSLKPTANQLFIHQKKDGLQFGEYFGAAVLGVNLNNDAYTDLLVGAPFASLPSGGDEGKVYVYISNGMGLQLFAQLYGDSKPSARFGTAIANVGDLNQDGFNDVAIGAPYEDGNGAIYLYHGARQGMKTQYIQKISAQEIKPSLSGFGIQISRGLDIDSNQYPDILVGAYASSEAVLFRTRPVVQISSKLIMSPQQINRNVTSCEYEGQPISCINVTSCISYTGKHAPLSLEFNDIVSLEHGSESYTIPQRGFFILPDGKQTSTLTSPRNVIIGIDNCHTDQLFIRPKIKDVITPMQIFFNYELARQKEENSKFCKSCPIVDPSSTTNQTKMLSFQTGCGQDDRCIADLVLKARIRDHPSHSSLIIGVNESIILDIDVENKGEPAYLSELLIYLPAELPSKNQDFCSELSDEQRRTSNASLICDLGNPLLKDKIVKIKIKLGVPKRSTVRKVVHIHLEASTGSLESNPKDNSLDVPITFQSIADISVTGIASHKQIPYNEETDESSLISISHSYFVMNHGPSPLQIIDIILYIPTAFPGSDGPKSFLMFTNFEAGSGMPETIRAECNDTDLAIKPASSDEKKVPGEVFGEHDLVEKGGDANKTIPNTDAVEKEKTTQDHQSTSRSKKSVETSLSNRKKKDVTINCDTAQCMAIRCSAAPFLDNREFVRITVSVELNSTVLNNVLEPWYKIEFVTAAEVFIRDGQEDIQPKLHHPDSTTVKTIIVQPGPPPSEEVAQWIIFVSIVAGILLLIIIMIILIKIGFFRRQQKDKIRQMMNQSSKDPCLIDDEVETVEAEST